jgi:uncharacterized protein involved in exopolysaccharide biosynthesis
MSVANDTPTAGDSEFDLPAMLSRVWAGRWILLACMILSTAAFLTAAFVTTPWYRAQTVLVDVSGGRGSGAMAAALSQLGGLASLVGMDLGSSGSMTEEALAVLRSREFTEAFIRDRGLMQTLLADRWDADARQWRDSEDDWPTLNDAFKVFNEQVRRVNRDTRTGLITLQIVWKDPTDAASWANDLVATLNAEMRARAIASTKASVGYLEAELAKTSTVETRQAITRLIEAEINRQMLANVTQEYVFRVVDRALPPDPDDEVWPPKIVFALAGPFVGLLAGALVVLIRKSLAGR